MRPQEQIDRILKFECGYCGAEVGRWCRRFVRGTSRTNHMSDFHMARTQAAYPQIAAKRNEMPKFRKKFSCFD